MMVTNNVIQGWNGRFYEDFEVGDIYPHPLGRTITQNDNIWFTQLTQNTNPIHFDEEYARKTDFGRPIVNSCFTLALVTGQSVGDISQNAMANLGWDDIKLPNPVFEGDTIYSYSEVLSKRPSATRENVGIITVKTCGYNQEAKIVIEFLRTMMVYKKDYAPTKENPLLNKVLKMGEST
ncbi:MAG TPA: MaoC family dehydratase [Ureibacillus sp.]|nr:MaoC family dehydratase [Ureibacillus sp.]